MKKIGVVYYQAGPFKGGGQQVTANIIEILQKNDFEVFLFIPDKKLLDINLINKRFNLKISNKLKIIGCKYCGLTFSLMDKIEKLPKCIITRYFNAFFKLIFQTLFIRKINKWNEKIQFDLLLFAANEPEFGFNCALGYNTEQELAEFNYRKFGLLDFGVPVLQYCLWPYVFVDKSNNIIRKYIKKFIEYLAGVEVNTTVNCTPFRKYLGDSKWTCDLLKLQDSLNVELVYPPVQVSRIQKAGHKWNDRENGFVCIGRIARTKNILRNISIIKQIRDRGYRVHLHIIGFTGDKKYKQEIDEKIADLDFIHFEGELTYEEMVHFIGRHKYGIHGQEYEHFGIVVAEMVAGGSIPFVPGSGGQVEIVNNLDLLVYNNREEAVSKIESVLSADNIQQELTNELQNSASRFEKSVFVTRINRAVKRTLER